MMIFLRVQGVQGRKNIGGHLKVLNRGIPNWFDPPQGPCDPANGFYTHIIDVHEV